MEYVEIKVLLANKNIKKCLTFCSFSVQMFCTQLFPGKTKQGQIKDEKNKSLHE